MSPALALLNRGANDAQRGAVISGGSQRAGVAMREHRGAVGNQLAAKLTQRSVRFDVFLKDGLGFID